MAELMRTSNPALNENVFAPSRSYSGTDTMSIQGTVNKTFVLLFILLAAAAWVWNKLQQPVTPFGDVVGEMTANVTPFMLAGVIGGFIIGLVTVFKKEWAPVTAPIYAFCEGLAIGGISGYFELSYPGIVIQAVTLTFCTLFCLLAAYKSGLIRATENFKLGVVAATGAICLVYFIDIVLGFFHHQVPFIHSSGPLGIGVSLFIVTIAALNLVLDFDFIENGARQGAPKYMEWYAAFGLMVTLIWLYLEILRLLSKMRRK